MNTVVRADKFVHLPTGRFVMLTCNVEPDHETGGYVSRCPALSVASQGDTIEEAEAGIREAVCLYLTAIDEDGELDRIFREHDLKVVVDGSLRRRAMRVRTVDGGTQLTTLFPIRQAAQAAEEGAVDLRLYSSDQTVRALRRLGILPRHEVTGAGKPKGTHWTFTHQVLIDGELRNVSGIVPLNKNPIKRPVMDSILEQLHLTEEDFERAAGKKSVA